MKLKIMIMALLLLAGIGSAVNTLPATTFVGDIDFASGYYARNAIVGLHNARDYGAVGDGVTDDTVALQAWLDCSAGNGIAFLPPGNYYKSGMLVPKNNTYVLGCGDASMIVDDATGFYIVGAYHDISINDIYLYGDGTLGRSGIEARNGATRLSVKGCRIENYGFMGIYACEIHSSHICNNHVCSNGKSVAYVGQGIHVAQSRGIGADEVIVAENICNDNGNIIADYYGGCHGIYISGNYTTTEDATNIIVSNNICNNNTGAGININCGREVVVDGNICDGNRWKGIALAGGCNNTILDGNKVSNILTRNKSYSGTGCGIYASHDTSNCVFTNNRVRNVNQSGMRLGGSGHVVEGNKISTVGDSGIKLDNPKNFTVVGNSVEDAARSGIYVLMADGVLLSSNTILRGSSEYSTGIFFSTTLNNAVVVGNRVADYTWGVSSSSMSGVSGICMANMVAHNTDPISSAILGSGMKVSHNSGTITEATGSSTGTGAEQTIAHGLRAEPHSVSVTPNVAGATATWWADDTNIYPTVTAGKTFHWSASRW